MKVSAPRLVDGLLLLVAAVWGSTYLAAKELITPSTVIAVLALRFGVTVVVMVPFVVRRLRRTRRAELATGMMLGGILATIFLFETYGIAHTSATNAGLIISLTMIMTPLLESVVSRSWLPPQFFAAAFMSVIGVALLASGQGMRAPALGDWLILLAAAIRAVHVIVMHKRSAGRDYDTVNLTFLQMATTAAVFGLAAPLTGESVATLVEQFGPTQWANLLYLLAG